MIIGYIRVSRDKQLTALQEDAMKRENCERVFMDKMTGRRIDRPEFLKMLDIARAGDVIIVWRLDRLGRNLKDLINLAEMFVKRGIGLKVLTGAGANIDTTTAHGRLVFGIFGALAEYEAELIKERTVAGLEAARARGKRGGRPKITEIIKPAQIERAKKLYAARENTVTEIMKLCGFNSRATFYKYVAGEPKQGNGEGRSYHPGENKGSRSF